MIEFVCEALCVFTACERTARWLMAVTSSCVLYFNIYESYCWLFCNLEQGAYGEARALPLSSVRIFSLSQVHSECHIVWLWVRCHSITDECWNYPKSRSGFIDRSKRQNLLQFCFWFWTKLILCHLLSYYILERCCHFFLLWTQKS
jgi:hypothetical protein